MKKYMFVAVMFLVLGAVIGAIVVFSGEETGEDQTLIVYNEPAAPQRTWTAEDFANTPFAGEDWDMDGVRNDQDEDPFKAVPAECQTWHDCEEGRFCYHNQCVLQRISLPDPARVCEDYDRDGVCDDDTRESDYDASWCDKNLELCAQVLSASAKAVMLWSLGLDPNQL